MRIAQEALGGTGVNLNQFNNVAVNISTGGHGSFPLEPSLIGDFVLSFNGTLVETNITVPMGDRRATDGGEVVGTETRFHTDTHAQLIARRGYNEISRGGRVHILDANDVTVTHPLQSCNNDVILTVGPSGITIPHNYVAAGLFQYDFIVNLNHFSGHSTAGFGAAKKNLSIGLASARGKDWIHNGGRGMRIPGLAFFGGLLNLNVNPPVPYGNLAQFGLTDRFEPILMQWLMDHDTYQRAAAEAALSVADAFTHGNYHVLHGVPFPTPFTDRSGNPRTRILHINVMNNLSVDCDCFTDIRPPDLPNIGILVSWDPVALDQASADMIFAAHRHNIANDIRHRANVLTEPTAMRASHVSGFLPAGYPSPDQNGRIMGEAMVERIAMGRGEMGLWWSEQIGLGTRNYVLIER